MDTSNTNMEHTLQATDYKFFKLPLPSDSTSAMPEGSDQSQHSRVPQVDDPRYAMYSDQLVPERLFLHPLNALAELFQVTSAQGDSAYELGDSRLLGLPHFRAGA